ncbi:TetR/AcrR family transcriptional regulator [Hyphomonas oceanitis]|uniref:TetR family transcriptional regulator n=1 Tax=Hyphomonas oceanitis SCH89 TaxID=1280953 RepID=A0A059G3P9_9PROT|nr:TetR/AcrR family transcriptional regulator [Hyphomonas oceanitis]KDA01406.1 TetR family transcriptional regulator [Hyphomonas oceanitis SCH89]MDE0811037.1 TetR/AcrR family transcriptional regulator [Alphaproteobacteria bacterium]
MAGQDGKTTREAMLEAAQNILADSGLEALNSNAIVEKAGVTPPTFYHYFSNKYAVLRELGMQMMDAQNEVLRADTGLMISTEAELEAACFNSIQRSYRMTRAFRGGYALLVSLRAVPELKEVRLNSHAEMAELLTRYMIEQKLCNDFDSVVVRARLGVEMRYAAIEMLFETNFRNEQTVLEYTAKALTRVYDFF